MARFPDRRAGRVAALDDGILWGRRRREWLVILPLFLRPRGPLDARTLPGAPRGREPRGLALVLVPDPRDGPHAGGRRGPDAGRIARRTEPAVARIPGGRALHPRPPGRGVF